MIKIEELRIGLWMKSTVMDLHPFRLTLKDIVNEVENTNHNGLFEPIPLTEEWLIKFGFKHHDGWDDMKFHFRDEDANNDNRFELLETNQGYETPSGQICKYVHQLQNCFYFHNLTGTELELKQ